MNKTNSYPVDRFDSNGVACISQGWRPIASRLLAVSVLLFVYIPPTLAVPKSAVIRRDGTFAVQPKIGTIVQVGEDRFVYALPKNSGPGFIVYVVKPNGEQKEVVEPTGVTIAFGTFSPLIADKAAPKRGELIFYCENAHGKKGLISETGRIILPPKYGCIGEVSEGHVVASIDPFGCKTKVIVFDEDGKQTGVAEHVSINGRTKFSGGLAPVLDENRKNCFITYGGKLTDAPAAVGSDGERANRLSSHKTL